ncbi:hypothetical protein Hte_008504 [Hypoxylon texense]
MPPFTTGQVLCGNDERGRGGCNIVHIAEVAENYANIPQPTRDWPDTRGLRALQDGHEEWVNGSAIDVALQVLHEHLPAAVRDKIHVQSTDIANLFVSDTTTFNSAMAGGYDRVFRQFSRREYSLWPINVFGNHWELVIMRKEGVANIKQGFGQYRRIIQMAVIDTWQTKRTERRRLVDGRLTAIFTSRGYQFAPECKRIVSVPVQNDGWSCGLRVFWEAKELMDRIVLLDTYDESLWDAIDRYFNAHTVRWEMVGLNASRAVREMDYKARVAIELVNEVEERDVRGEVVRSKDAAEELKPVADSPLPAKRKRLASDTGPEQRPATRRKTASPKTVRKVNPANNGSAHFSTSSPLSPLPPDGTPERPVVLSESSSAKNTSSPQTSSPAKNTSSPQTSSPAKKTSSSQTSSSAKNTSSPQTSSPAKNTSSPQTSSSPRPTAAPQTSSSESPVSVPSGPEIEQLQYSSDDGEVPTVRSSASKLSAPEPSAPEPSAPEPSAPEPSAPAPVSEYTPRPILGSTPVIGNTSKTSIAPTTAPAPAKSSPSSAYTPRPILGSTPGTNKSSSFDRLRSTHTRSQPRPSNTPTAPSKATPTTTSRPITSSNNSGKQPLRFPLTNSPSTRQARQQSSQILRNALQTSPGPTENPQSDPSHSRQGQ